MGAAKMREGQRANNQKAPWEGLQTGAWETFSTQDCPLPWKVFFNIMGQILRNETKKRKAYGFTNGDCHRVQNTCRYLSETGQALQPLMC